MLSLIEQLTSAHSHANMRKCSVCGEHKPRDQFSIKNKLRGWLDTRCKQCKSIQIEKIRKGKIMKKVRKGVFETNSSSTHSLVIAENFDQTIAPPIPEHMIKDGVYTIFTDEFGWEVETHYDLATKASYLVVDAINRMSLGKDDDVNDRSIFDTSDHLRMIEDAFNEFAGVSIHIEKCNDIYYPWGYIDHQSIGECNAVWEQGTLGVIKFLFSQDSTLHTDNDNH